MSRRSQQVRQIQDVELLREHWVNGQRFPPGTVLCLPASCASNLIEAGAAATIATLASEAREGFEELRNSAGSLWSPPSLPPAKCNGTASDGDIDPAACASPATASRRLPEPFAPPVWTARSVPPHSLFTEIIDESPKPPRRADLCRPPDRAWGDCDRGGSGGIG